MRWVLVFDCKENIIQWKTFLSGNCVAVFVRTAKSNIMSRNMAFVHWSRQSGVYQISFSLWKFLMMYGRRSSSSVGWCLQSCKNDQAFYKVEYSHIRFNWEFSSSRFSLFSMKKRKCLAKSVLPNEPHQRWEANLENSVQTVRGQALSSILFNLKFFLFTKHKTFG